MEVQRYFPFFFLDFSLLPKSPPKAPFIVFEAPLGHGVVGRVEVVGMKIEKVGKVEGNRLPDVLVGLVTPSRGSLEWVTMSHHFLFDLFCPLCHRKVEKRVKCR